MRRYDPDTVERPLGSAYNQMVLHISKSLTPITVIAPYNLLSQPQVRQTYV